MEENQFMEKWANAVNNLRNNAINGLNVKGNAVKEKVKNALFKVYAYKMSTFIDDWFANAFDAVIDTQEDITFCDIPLNHVMQNPSNAVLQVISTYMATQRNKEGQVIDDALIKVYEEASQLLKNINRNYQACVDELKPLISTSIMDIVVLDEEHRSAKWEERKDAIKTVFDLYSDKLNVIEEEVDAFVEEVVSNAYKKYKEKAE